MAKKSKKWIWIPTVILVVIALAAGVVYFSDNKKEPVYVYGVTDVAGMYGNYDYNNESSGMVTTDRVQTVFLSTTQTITEIFVEEGQTVSKGDVLFTYDTTLSDIELQKKDLSIQQAKLDLETLKQELVAISSYVPISYHPVDPVEPTLPEEPEVDLSELDLDGKDYLDYSGNGTSTLSPKYVWLRTTAMVDRAMLEALFSGATSDVMYIVFQNTEGNSNEGSIIDQFGVKVMRLVPSSAEAGTEYSYRMSFYDPHKVGSVGPVDDGIDWNSGYTAAEIAAMRAEKEMQIKEAELAIKMSEAEYKIMQKEADDGQVIADFDGKVINLMDPESIRFTHEPLMKVTGGGGYYVEGNVSELDLNNIEIGQKVDVMSWDTGMTYEGTVIEIQQFPIENEYGYYGYSQNVSYYPYRIFIDDTAELQDGYYVSMRMQTEESGGSLYLNNAFIISEGASNYVFVRNSEGVLEKRKIQVAGSLWGDYTKVSGGLSTDDYIAFPYGKQVKPGMPTAEGTWENLSGY